MTMVDREYFNTECDAGARRRSSDMTVPDPTSPVTAGRSSSPNVTVYPRGTGKNNGAADSLNGTVKPCNGLVDDDTRFGFVAFTASAATGTNITVQNPPGASDTVPLPQKCASVRSPDKP